MIPVCTFPQLLKTFKQFAIEKKRGCFLFFFCYLEWRLRKMCIIYCKSIVISPEVAQLYVLLIHFFFVILHGFTCVLFVVTMIL